ncbi:hypothetical protein CYMTET_18946 [Cymbomonas tetramitiformis]|uniref:Uncharacterized protein n=1 Tax=Cymbomonas tetramitiformis TaxID=36881 RepID=A0AAE0G7F5_9CHLO|nr:hypothetical protein CYMTET_18946 [Cymbomonas tetramitiformis]
MNAVHQLPGGNSPEPYGLDTCTIPATTAAVKRETPVQAFETLFRHLVRGQDSVGEGLRWLQLSQRETGPTFEGARSMAALVELLQRETVVWQRSSDICAAKPAGIWLQQLPAALQTSVLTLLRCEAAMCPLPGLLNLCDRLSRLGGGADLWACFTAKQFARCDYEPRSSLFAPYALFPSGRTVPQMR